MARTFNLTANLVLAGPSNLKPIVTQIQGALNNIKCDVQVKINPQSITQLNALNTAFKTFNTTLMTAKTNISSVAIALGQLNSSINNVKLNNLNQQLNQVNTQQKQLANHLRAGRTELEEFGRVSGLAVRRFAGFAATTGVIMGLISSFKNATGAAIGFQSQMVKLGQLTGGSVSQMYTQFGNQITQLSTTLGVSSEKLGEIAHKLVQAGLSAREMAQVMDALAKSMNAPAFHNVDQTMEGTIAMMKQFGIKANEVEASLSSMHAMASKFAVESQDLISAVRIAGGSFSSMSKGIVEGREALNQFMAVFTAVRGTTRESAESIATGLRTIFARLERPEAIVTLKQLGVELVDLNGKFVGPYEAVNRLATALKGLDPKDIRYAEVAESLGGYRQIGKVLPLLQQTELRMKAFQVAQQGQNQLAEANVKAQQSWEVQLGKVHERFLALVRDVSQTQGFKDLMNIFLLMANSLVHLGEALKPILPLMAAIAVYKGTMAAGQLATGLMSGLRGKAMATGGLVPGQGNGDTVPAVLTPGEFVIRKDAVKTIGVQNLSKLNRYADGGYANMITMSPIPEHLQQNWLKHGVRTGNMSPAVNQAFSAYTEAELPQISQRLGLIIGNAAQFSPESGPLVLPGGFDKNQTNTIRGIFFEQALARLGGSFSGIEGGRIDFEHLARMGKDGRTLGEHLGLNQAMSLSPMEAKLNLINEEGQTLHSPSEIREKFGLGRFDVTHDYESDKARRRAKNRARLGLASGGYATTPNAMLTPGEFVIGAGAAAALGSSTLHAMNYADKLPGYAWGGYGPGTPGTGYYIKHGLNSAKNFLQEHAMGASIIGGAALQMMAPDNQYVQAAGSAMEGAAMGGQFGGPWGALAGGALGGASSLLQAPAVQAQKAATEAVRKSEEQLSAAFDKLSKGGSLDAFDNALKNSIQAINQKAAADALQAKLSSGNAFGLFGSGGVVSDKANAENGILSRILHGYKQIWSPAATNLEDAQQLDRIRGGLIGEDVHVRQQLAAQTLQAHEKTGSRTYTQDELRTLSSQSDDATIFSGNRLRVQEYRQRGLYKKANNLESKNASMEEDAGRKIADASNKAADDLGKFTDTMVRGDAAVAQFIGSMKEISAIMNRVSAIGLGGSAVINAIGTGGIMSYQGENVFKNPLAFKGLDSAYLSISKQFGTPGEQTTKAAEYMESVNNLERNLPNIMSRAANSEKGPETSLLEQISGTSAYKSAPAAIQNQIKAQIDKLWEDNKKANISTQTFLADDKTSKLFLNILKPLQDAAMGAGIKLTENIDDILERQRQALEKQLALQIQINQKSADIAQLEGQHTLNLFKIEHPYSHITAGQAYEPIKNRLSSLAQLGGLTAGEGTNVTTAGIQLNALNRALYNKSNELKIASDSHDINAVGNIRNDISIYQEMKDAIVKQLDILHIDNIKIQAIEEDLAYLQKKHEAAGDLMKQFLMSNPEERFKMIRELNMAAANNAAGNPMPRNMIAQQMILGGMGLGAGLLGPEEANRRQTQMFLNSGANGPFGEMLKNVKDQRAGQALIMQLASAQQVQIQAGNVQIHAAQLEKGMVGEAAGNMRGTMFEQQGKATGMAGGGWVSANGGDPTKFGYSWHHGDLMSPNGILSTYDLNSVNAPWNQSDTVPTMLTPGEFVVNKKAAQKHAMDLMAMNAGLTPMATSAYGLRLQMNRARYEATHHSAHHYDMAKIREYNLARTASIRNHAGIATNGTPMKAPGIYGPGIGHYEDSFGRPIDMHPMKWHTIDGGSGPTIHGTNTHPGINFEGGHYHGVYDTSSPALRTYALIDQERKDRQNANRSNAIYNQREWENSWSHHRALQNRLNIKSMIPAGVVPDKALDGLNKTLSSIPQKFSHEMAPVEHTHRVVGESSLAQAIVGAVTEHINTLVNRRVSQSINPVTGESNPSAYQ